MINHDLFKKETIAHGLLTSATYPNILIPIKMMIKDIKFDHNNPKYTVKIFTFYDEISFLKKYLYNCKFRKPDDRSPRSLYLREGDLNSKQSIIDRLNELGQGGYVLIDSVMTRRYKKDIMDLFHKLEDYFIAKLLREWRQRSIRNIYKGRFNLENRDEWIARFKNAMYDRIQEQDQKPEEIIKWLAFDERIKRKLF